MHIENVKKGQWVTCLDSENMAGIPFKVAGVSAPFVFLIPFGTSIDSPLILDIRKESLTTLQTSYVNAILKNRKDKKKAAAERQPRQIVLRGERREIVAIPIGLPPQCEGPPPPPPILDEDDEVEVEAPPPPPETEED